MSEDRDWRDMALCKYVDGNLFFPDKGDTARAKAAKRICNVCPSVEPCLKWALETSQGGIWGGTTEKERRSLHILKTRCSRGHLLVGSNVRVDAAGRQWCKACRRNERNESIQRAIG